MSSISFDPSTGLTCLSCRVVFANGTVQRGHYQSEWHRYNLQRKVAELPPITLERFQQKVLLHKDSNTQSTDPSIIFCGPCNKQFQSKNAFENHVKSKKHRENERKEPNKGSKMEFVNGAAKVVKGSEQSDDDLKVHTVESELDDTDSEEWVTDHESGEEERDSFDETKAIHTSTCLFCSTPSSSMEENLEHMGIHHGFFIPDAEYCVDMQGMLNYLGLKVGSGNMCLLCNEKGKRFYSIDACQKHMRDTGHCRVAHEAVDMLEYEDFYDYSPMYQTDEDEKPFILEGYSLILPSGAQIGHRSLMRYYRQRLRPDSSRSKSMNERNLTNRILKQYKALGWTGTTGPLAVQRARDIRFMKNLGSKQWMKLGIQSSKLFKSRGRAGQ